MSLTLPTLPSIAAGQIPTPSQMNAIGSACNFLLNKPVTLVKDSTGTQAIASAGTFITYTGSNVVQMDADGMFSSGNPDRLTVQTPGWYKVRYAVTLASTTGNACNGGVFSTTGSNNPAGSGHTSSAYWAGYCDVYPGAMQGRGIWPFYLYPGDFIRVQVFAATGDVGLTQSKLDVGGTGGMGSLLSLEHVGCTP